METSTRVAYWLTVIYAFTSFYGVATAVTLAVVGPRGAFALIAAHPLRFVVGVLIACLYLAAALLLDRERWEGALLGVVLFGWSLGILLLRRPPHVSLWDLIPLTGFIAAAVALVALRAQPNRLATTP